MTSESSTDGTLTDTYESHIGKASTDDEASGYWLFILGAILGIVGVLLFLNSQSAGSLRQWSIVLAAAGLVLMIAGPIIRLPLQAKATTMVAIGGVISAAGILWFVTAYPAQWSPQTGNLAIIALYAVGVLVIAAAGAFVPVLTDRGGNDARVAALQAELEELRASANRSEADDSEHADEVAELESALGDADAENSNLESDVEQLQADLADAKADEAELAVLLSELQESESQFELYEDRGGSWRWRLRHRDGEVIASSDEGHERQNDAQAGLQAVRRDAYGATFLLVETEEELPETESSEGFLFPGETDSQATFELYEDDGGEYRWRLRHDNGNMIAHGGQGYASRAGAEHSAERIRGYVGPAEYLQPDPTAIEVYRDEASEWRWRLRHKNGTLLAGSGEGYETRAEMRQVIDRLRDDMDTLKIEVYEDEAGEYRWRLDGGEEHVIADSGGYESKAGAQEAVEHVRTSMPEADLIDVGEAAFEIYVDEGEEHRWRLRHRNGNVLASCGEGYSSRTGVWDGIESVKRNAPDAGFEETDE
ncbi:MAG: DUF1508 domain-containing protein [Halobacteriales archaeon]|nr:DUF1508 domain-containing protein [Halobacteriales archaeon]